MKGEAQYKKFKRGERLTRGQAILAQCYDCNDGHRGENPDCKGLTCPLYQYMPYNRL